jgi:hypothetical protein
MRQIVGLIAGIVVLAGCTTTPDHKGILDTWIGKTSAELVSVWGPPSKEVSQISGEKILEYSRAENLSYGGGTVTKTQTMYTEHGMSTAGSNGGSMLSSSRATRADQIPHSVDGKEITWICIIRFTVGVDSRIVQWTEQGNDCKSGLPKDSALLLAPSK